MALHIALVSITDYLNIFVSYSRPVAMRFLEFMGNPFQKNFFPLHTQLHSKQNDSSLLVCLVAFET